MRRRKALDRLIIVLILIIVAGTSVILFTKLKTDQITRSIDSGEPINMLIMVHDEGELIFSDLFLYDSNTGKGALFDIPGYIGTIINKLKKMDRIDVLFDRSDPSVYAEKVAAILKVEIPYYISMDIKNFAKIVDLFNGIKIFIANPVELLDPDNLILLPSGNLVLDGAKTIAYMEYDDELLSDVEHISRRQKIIQSLFTQFDVYDNLLDSKEFASYLRSYISTNLKKDAFLSYFGIFSKLDTERIVFQRVLGTTRLVGEKNLLFPHYEGNLLRETVQQTIGSLANTDVISADELNVTMDILNGTGQTGLASRTAQVFKSFGYDISRVANFEEDIIEKTIIVSLNGDRITAEKVAEIILCNEISYEPDNYFENDIDTALNNAEIIIILGKDFDGRYCKD